MKPGWYVLEKYDGRTARPMNGTITTEVAEGPFETEEAAFDAKERRKSGLRVAGVSGTYYTVAHSDRMPFIGDESFLLDQYEEPLGDDDGW